MTARAWDLLTLACLLVGGILVSTSLARLLTPEPLQFALEHQSVTIINTRPVAPGRVPEPDNLDL